MPRSADSQLSHLQFLTVPANAANCVQRCHHYQNIASWTCWASASDLPIPWSFSF